MVLVERNPVTGEKVRQQGKPYPRWPRGAGLDWFLCDAMVDNPLSDRCWGNLFWCAGDRAHADRAEQAGQAQHQDRTLLHAAAQELQLQVGGHHRKTGLCHREMFGPYTSPEWIVYPDCATKAQHLLFGTTAHSVEITRVLCGFHSRRPGSSPDLSYGSDSTGCTSARHSLRGSNKGVRARSILRARKSHGRATSNPTEGRGCHFACHHPLWV